MNVLHLITSLKVGGAERALCNLLEVLSVRDMKHHVAYFYDGPCRQTLEALSIPCYQIQGVASCYDPVAIIRLCKVIRALKPDVIHTSLWSANIIGRILGSMMSIPVISDLHGNCNDEGRFRNIFDRATAHLTYRTVAVAQTVQESYQKTIISSIRQKKRQEQTKSRLIVIHNGIDVRALEHFAQPNHQKLSLPPTSFVIGSVGRLEPIKSYDLLIRAFHKAFRELTKTYDVCLVLIGDGSEMSKLKHMASNLGLDKQVMFTGFEANPYPYYQLFDCFALSSQSEGLSIALLEAMAFGLPIITTHGDQHHDVITDQINGILVPVNNIELYAQAILKLYKNPSLRRAQGERNRCLVRDKFSISSVGSAYEGLFLNAHKINQSENIFRP